MNTHAVLLIAVSALVTALIRFAPFLVFRGGRETPAVILRLGKLLPCAVMSMLVVYCLRNMNFAGASHALPEIIARSLRIKARVVEQDPTEHGLRRVLNFGHTLGHAIESCAGGELLHGECVALGMVPMCAPPLRPRLTAILQRCGLPTECGCTAGQLLPYLLHDKKAASGSIAAVLVDEPGTFRMETMTPEEILRRWEGAET